MDRILKVFLDTSPLKTGHAVRGIGAYTRNLISAIKQYCHKEVKIDAVDFKNSDLRFTNYDLLHFPYFDLFFDTLHVHPEIPTVVTIFDVIPLIYPEHYPPGIRGKINFFKQKMLLGKVAAVITISETSKKDIVRFLDVPQEKVYVTYLAPANNFKPITNHRLLITARKKYQLPDSFVLYVGDVNYNKNILGLAKACKILKVPLVIVGKQAAQEDFDRSHPENQPLVQLIEQYGDDPDVLRLGFVPEDDLVAIYNLATVYCQPSFYEGFGLPILEAMAAGCPVVAGKTQALVEIAQDATLLVDPKDYNQIAQGILKVFSDQKTRADLIRKGLARVKDFSWGKAAQKTVEVYAQAKK